MWIKELGGENFAGMNFKDEYLKNEVRISGRNRSGKSTRIKAFYWLLSSYTDANSVANANLFDNRVPLTKDTPEARVWARIVLDNGEEYLIERMAKAKFTRRRGTDIFEKAPSDEYSYRIDHIERNATDFREWVSANIAPDDMLRFCLDGMFFVNMCFDDKKKARQLIEKVVGEVKPEEMKGDYTAIAELLTKYTLEEIDTRAANMAKGINQRLTEIPLLLQNIEREVSEIEQTDFAAIDREINTLEDERENLDERLLDLTERVKPQMEAKYKAETEKRMKTEVYEKAFSDFVHANDAEIDRLKGEIAAVVKQNTESKRAYDAAVAKKEAAEKERDLHLNALKAAETKRERLLQQRDYEKAKTMPQDATNCPHCGAALTGDKLQQVVDNFERIRRENIDSIVAQGKANNIEIERLTKQIYELQDIIDAPLPQVLDQSTADLEKRVAELSSHIPTKADFDASEHGKALLDDIAAVAIPEVQMPNDTEIKAAKAEVNAKLVPLYEKCGLRDRAESLKAQADTLRAERVEKGAELALYERQRQLVKDYKQEQMEILSHKVNDGLSSSHIDVWSTQKDGTIVPDIVLKDSQDVNFACTNNASRIVTTVDVQRFFCEKLGVNMPVFVDECSVLDAANLPGIPGTQMFYLFRADTSITIETK